MKSVRDAPRRKCVFVLLIGLFALSGASGQPVTCSCDYVINKAGMYRLSAVQPGQTICVQAGHYEWLRFFDLLGAPGNPIRVINTGGQVTIGGSAYYAGLQFFTCRYFVLTGTGDPQYPYGIKLTETGPNATAVNIGGKSSDCEVTGVEVAQAGFAGIMVKTDPTCDSSTWRSAFTMTNVAIHHNYIHDVGGEGLYLGSSFWNGRTITCNGVNRTVYPHPIVGLSVHHNLIERSGAEGLQYACAPDAQVHHNTIRQAGQSPFAAYQNNGIQIGSGGGGSCYANTIRQVAGSGLIIIGHLGNNLIYNNVISDVGENGIFCDDREGSLTNTYTAFVNNTLVRCGHDGIKLYNQNNVITVDNNVIVGIGPNRRYVSLGQGAAVTPRTNFTSNDVSQAFFVDPAGSNFRLSAGSPLIDAGRSVSSWGIDRDAADQFRPQNGLYDIGAYEFGSANAAQSTKAATPGTTAFLLKSNTDPIVLKPVSNNELMHREALVIFPSPGTDQVTLHLSTNESITMLTVHNARGQRCRVRLSHTSGVNQLDISALPAGSYVVQLKAGSNRYTSRFVKQ